MKKPRWARDKDDKDIFNNANRLLKENGHSDEIAAYTDMRKPTASWAALFGPEGGFNHTVDLCPLMSGDGDQRHGECSSFAFVETYAVDGQAWSVVGSTSGDFRTPTTTWSRRAWPGLDGQHGPGRRREPCRRPGDLHRQDRR